VIKNMAEASLLGGFIKEQTPPEEFYTVFRNRFSKGFDPSTDLQRIGVVNQTTMLAEETQQIADYLKLAIQERYRSLNENAADSFADTRDTLCYATNDNQSAVTAMLSTPADLAIVVGGYNSSNTSHLVELCEKRLPTFFIENPAKMISGEEILHFDLHEHQEKLTTRYLPEKNPLRVLITSGASCPDAIVESVISRLNDLIKGSKSISELITQFDTNG
jgi:4-hydroxy-3-methylbut-2-enyl diphosphate reductase